VLRSEFEKWVKDTALTARDLVGNAEVIQTKYVRKLLQDLGQLQEDPHPVRELVREVREYFLQPGQAMWQGPVHAADIVEKWLEEEGL